MGNLKSSLADNTELQSIKASMSNRTDGRANDQPRPIKIITNYTMHAEGSVLVEFGNTKLICTASIEETLPPFLRNKGKGGWLTAEYGMLPRSTSQRMNREATQGKVGGRTHEIQRLIGRSLRSVIDLTKIGERTIKVDCDVIQADGGTRTAAITGAYVAVILALRVLVKNKKVKRLPPVKQVAALSVGIVKGETMSDLKYDEDSNAEVDLNVVMHSDGKLIEVQGTAEDKSFSRAQLNDMLDYAEIGLEQCFKAQMEALGGYLVFRKENS